MFALLFSSAIAVAAAWDQFMRSKELWVQKTDTWMALQNLQAHIEYGKAKVGEENIGQEQVDRFYAKFDSIIMGEHGAWKKVRDAPGPSHAQAKVNEPNQAVESDGPKPPAPHRRRSPDNRSTPWGNVR